MMCTFTHATITSPSHAFILYNYCNKSNTFIGFFVLFSEIAKIRMLSIWSSLNLGEIIEIINISWSLEIEFEIKIMIITINWTLEIDKTIYGYL